MMRSNDTLRTRFVDWLYLTGDRTVVTAVVLLGIVVLTAVLVKADLITVGPQSRLAPMLRSGVLAGLLTLVTVALTLNQLVLSRVFGDPSELTETLDQNIEFRHRVEEIAGERTSPNDPSSFLVLVAEALGDRADSLQSLAESTESAATDDDLREYVADLREYVADLREYADHLRTAEASDSTVQTLFVIIGTGYATELTETRYLRKRYEDSDAADDCPDELGDALDDVFSLLKAVATIRQFFKTLAIQQELADLSRHVIYLGLAAILSTFYLTLVYEQSAMTTLPPTALSWVVVAGIAVIFSPLAMLFAHLLRIGTVSLYTASVGTFVPPEERIDRR